VFARKTPRLNQLRHKKLTNMKLLIIEDSERLRNSLEFGLSRLGYVVTSTGDGQQGLDIALSNDFDLIILDIMLPSLDGIGVLKGLRRRKNRTSVLILSAKDELNDKVLGLNIGADDYLCKPFAFEELQARIKSLLRRTHDLESDSLIIGQLTIDVSMRQVFVDHQPLNLTPHEYSILEHLALNRGRVISYANLENYLYNNNEIVTRNAIEAHVSATRKKLKLACGQSIIKTRRGFGYLIERPTQKTKSAESGTNT